MDAFKPKGYDHKENCHFYSHLFLDRYPKKGDHTSYAKLKILSDLKFPGDWKSFEVAEADLRMKALTKYKSQCQCCGVSPKENAVMVVSRIQSEKLYPELAMELDNLQVLCSVCNAGKGGQTYGMAHWVPKEPSDSTDQYQDTLNDFSGIRHLKSL